MKKFKGVSKFGRAWNEIVDHANKSVTTVTPHGVKAVKVGGNLSLGPDSWFEWFLIDQSMWRIGTDPDKIFQAWIRGVKQEYVSLKHFQGLAIDGMIVMGFFDGTVWQLTHGGATVVSGTVLEDGYFKPDIDPEESHIKYAPWFTETVPSSGDNLPVVGRTALFQWDHLRHYFIPTAEVCS